MFGSINRSSKGRGLNGEDAHARVVAGDRLLDEELPLVAAALHGCKRRSKLRRVAQEEDLVDIDFRLLEGYSGILQDSAQSVESLL